MAVANPASNAENGVPGSGSESEAIEAFGDGTDVVVVGGATIVVPEIRTAGSAPRRRCCSRTRRSPGITRDGSRVTIGATTAVEELVDLPAPIGPCAANIADREIRSVATVGGNICAGEGYEAPRGDLQGAFLAVGASVRSAGEGGVEEEPLEDFMPRRHGRLVLSISYDEPAAGAFAGLDRPHTHDYTALAVSGARQRTARSASLRREPARTASACPPPRAATPLLR